MLKNNAPCTCKHSKANHLSPYFTAEKNMIDAVMGCSVKFCSCNEFRLDNLRYLEKEYDAKSGE